MYKLWKQKNPLFAYPTDSSIPLQVTTECLMEVILLSLAHRHRLPCVHILYTGSNAAMCFSVSADDEWHACIVHPCGFEVNRYIESIVNNN